MDDNKKEEQTAHERSIEIMDGIEQLSLAVSTLRSWAVCPSLFDHISIEDRQNLLLSVLERAEAAQEKLSQAA